MAHYISKPRQPSEKTIRPSEDFQTAFPVGGVWRRIQSRT
ncbi:hypothetical protein HMPREF9120_02542 [Neisseria sp. oral taxon 020 str. F0370]|nr:hypothetical protein HMPREF9120_02542 [Neisseria sp. oral taxon 020 str. F0370]